MGISLPLGGSASLVMLPAAGVLHAAPSHIYIYISTLSTLHHCDTHLVLPCLTMPLVMSLPCSAPISIWAAGSDQLNSNPLGINVYHCNPPNSASGLVNNCLQPLQHTNSILHADAVKRPCYMYMILPLGIPVLACMYLIYISDPNLPWPNCAILCHTICLVDDGNESPMNHCM